MNDKRIVILLSGSGSNLQAFIDYQRQGLLGGQIVAVISNKADAFGLTRAQNASIETQVIEHINYDSRGAFDRAMASQINQYQPDLIILAGFMRILTPEFVNTFSGKLLNIHPSLLPKYPGLHTHKRALENKDSYHGSSVHFVTEELDGGPVITQARMPLDHTADEATVMQQVQKMEHQLYPQTAAWFLSGKFEIKMDGIYFEQKKLEKPIIVN